MQQVISFYTLEINLLNTKLQKLKKQLFITRIFRFISFLNILLTSYLAIKNTNILFFLSSFFCIVFIYLIVKHAQLKQQEKLIKNKLEINKTELIVLKGDFLHLNTGEEFTNPNHYFSNDIDLFGAGSFFQYINRTATNEGKKELAELLTSNNTNAIIEKQNAINELASKIKWRQHFTAIANSVNTQNSTNFIITWMQSYQRKLPLFLKKVPYLFSLVSINLCCLVYFNYIPFGILLTWFFIGLVITIIYLKKIQKLATQVTTIKNTFNQYYNLLKEIENEKFSNKTLRNKQQNIWLCSKKASVICNEFYKNIDTFDQRNNVFIAILGNGLFLWDIRNSIKIENWIFTYKNTVKKWFKTVSYFDSQNSLANFVFNNPNYVFPSITNNQTIVSAIDLGHPLLNTSKRINNNLTINKEHFFIITGANMAGKSTFLRSVSLAIVMANSGLPICANKFNYSPIKLITSMRTSDSLKEQESYFYAELKRLKFITEKIKSENYFIILDEILKGTNSEDKAMGSIKFVKKLNNSKSTGIIATHDVSLCNLALKHSTIKNYYFDAKIQQNELFFDYKIKAGICKNRNASFLLKKMNIV